MPERPDLAQLSRAELIKLLEERHDTDSDWVRQTPTVGAPTDAAYTDVYNALPTGIVETDMDQRVVRCNRAFAAMVGVPANDVVGSFGWDFFHPDSPLPDPSAVVDLCAGRRSSYSVDRLLRGPTGSALPVQMDWAVVRGETGEAQVLMCAVTDVSGHARTAAELRRARERAEVLWRRAPIGIIEATPEGVITSVNPALAAVVGRDPDELLGTPANQLGYPADSPAIKATIRELVQSGVDSSAERRYVHADGRMVPVHVSAAALHEDSGAVDRVTAFVIDMSEVHAQREALTEALAEITLARDELNRRQHFTDTLLETIDVGIVSCDADGTIVTRNSAERRMLDLSGQHAPTAIADVAALIDILDATGRRIDPDQYPLARALRGEKVTGTDFQLGPRGGPHRDVVMRGSRITTPSSTILGAVVALTDVTAERTTLRELAAERERLGEAQRLGHIGSYSYDTAEGRYRFSAELLRIWGLAPDADLAAVSQQMVHPDDLARVLTQWQSGLTVAGEHSIEYRIVRPDGSVRHLQVSREVHLNPAGAAVAWHGTHRDITDLTAARSEALEANKLLSAVLTATPDYTFVTDLASGAVVYGSPGKSLLGLTAEQLAEFGPSLIANVVHPDEQHHLRAANIAARDLADGEVLHLRYQGQHTDGTWHWLDRRVTPFRRSESTGQVVEVLGVVRDVTEEHHTALALRDQEQRLRALVTQVVDYAIIGLDPAGNIESWNDGAQRLKGYTAEQAVGRSFSIFYTDQDRDAGLPGWLLAEALVRGRVQNTGWRVRSDGTLFWADVVITALRDDHGLHTGFVKVTQDLTAQHRLEQAQESFFATVTHDLRTPIFAIKLFTELVNDVGPAKQVEYLQRIGVLADQLGDLVSDLFDYAKIRNQSITTSLEPLALAPFAKSVVDNFGPTLHGHVVTVQDSDLAAWADRTAMNRILQNLLTNAAKYSATGSPIDLTLDASADLVRLSVIDRGRGIAREDLVTVFDEFTRGRLAEDDGGTGLGLASVKRLTTLQGGRAWIDSRPGKGTIVTIELARAPETSSARTTAAEG